MKSMLTFFLPTYFIADFFPAGSRFSLVKSPANPPCSEVKLECNYEMEVAALPW